MGLNVVAFLGLLATVAILRGVELVISRRHQRALREKRVRQISEPHFRWMVLVHAGILIGAAVEVTLLNRPLIPMLAVAMGVVVLLANGMRWWVIYTLGRHWNVQVMDSLTLGVVTKGPYRAIRHPNYVAVFLELVALPLVHSAWLTALLGSIAHVWVLSRRVAVEDAVLLANPQYRGAMAHKPRFIPGPLGARKRRSALVALIVGLLGSHVLRGEPVSVRHTEGIVVPTKNSILSNPGMSGASGRRVRCG